MNSKDVYGLIEAADKCRSEIVLCLMGKPGIGKTESIERFARNNGRNVVHIIASQILPNEVSGMTMPDQETHTMDVFDHVRLGHMEDGDILFFDELLKGQTQVLNACLTLIQERRLMSGKKLPDVLIIAAANPLASPSKLPLEIRQRFMFVNVDWSEESWIDYMESKGFDNRDGLKKMAAFIHGKLEDDASGDWNMLTPRTATKLCEWARSVIGTEGEPIVMDYIERQFSMTMKNMVITCSDAGRIRREKTMDKLWSEIPDGVKSEQMKEVMRKYVEDADADSLSALIDRLMELPEWKEIEQALKDTVINYK